MSIDSYIFHIHSLLLLSYRASNMTPGSTGVSILNVASPKVKMFTNVVFCFGH